MINWLNSNQGATTAILTAVYVIATIAIVSMMVKANALTQMNIQLSKELDQARLRPYIIFDIITEGSLFYLELRNEGLSPAVNIFVKISPELNTKNRGSPFAFVHSPISFIAPQRKMKDFISAGWSFFEIHKNPKFRCDISYEDISGHKFQEVIELDLNYLKNVQQIALQETPKEINHLRNELRDFKVAVMKLWNLQIKQSAKAENDEPN